MVVYACANTLRSTMNTGSGPKARLSPGESFTFWLLAICLPFTKVPLVLRHHKRTQQNKKKTTLGWVVDGEKTPRWAVGGIDPQQPSGVEHHDL